MSKTKEQTKLDFYELLSKNGFEVLEDNYQSAHSKINCVDKDGYKYQIKQNVFVYREASNRFRSNEFAEYNLDLFMSRYYPKFTRLEKYEGVMKHLKYVDDNGYLYSIQPNKVVNGDRNPNEWYKNPYAIDNIKHWLSINQPTQKLKDGQEWKSMKDKLIFVCDKHGEYSQKFFVKYYMNCGCKECSKVCWVNNGFYTETLADRNPQWDEIDAYVYIVKLKDENEEFYKIGLAQVKSRDRFKRIPYEVTIIDKIYCSLTEAIKIESELHEKYSDFSYTPIKKFDGYTECFEGLGDIYN